MKVISTEAILSVDKNESEVNQIKIIFIINKITNYLLTNLKMREISMEERKRRKNCLSVLDPSCQPFF